MLNRLIPSVDWDRCAPTSDAKLLDVRPHRLRRGLPASQIAILLPSNRKVVILALIHHLYIILSLPRTRCMMSKLLANKHKALWSGGVDEHFAIWRQWSKRAVLRRESGFRGLKNARFIFSIMHETVSW